MTIIRAVTRTSVQYPYSFTRTALSSVSETRQRLYHNCYIRPDPASHYTHRFSSNSFYPRLYPNRTMSSNKEKSSDDTHDNVSRSTVPDGTLHQPSGEETWKTHEPYRIHETNDHFEARYDAECHCGKVKYQLSREVPLASKYCHCTTCQRLHGT